MKLFTILICITLITPMAFIRSGETPVLADVADELGPMDRYRYTIRIDDDEDLSTFPGDGTPSSPYIIEEKEIDADGRGTAIYIGNTTAHFLLKSSRLTRASEDPSYYHWNSCLVLYNVTNGRIYNNTFERGSKGLYLKDVYNVTVDSNHITQSTSCAVHVESSRKVRIFNNDILSCTGTGIRLLQSDNIDINSNRLVNNRREGIHVQDSHHNRVKDNQILDNPIDGLFLQNSVDNLLYNNDFRGTGIRIQGDTLENWNSHSIPDNNTLEGFPVCYLNDQAGTLPEEPGQVILVNVTDIFVENMELHKGSTGLALAFSDGISVRNVSISSQAQTGLHVFNSGNNTFSHLDIINNPKGVLVESSGDNHLDNISVTDNPSGGIEVVDSPWFYLRDSLLDNNGAFGVRIHLCPYSTLTQNTYTSNRRGLSIERSNGIDISGGNFSQCTEGVFLSYSTEMNMEENVFDGFGLRIAGNLKEHWSSHEINDNTVIGKPLVYLDHLTGGELNEKAGQIILANTTELSIVDQDVVSISLGFSSRIYVNNVTSYNNSRDAVHIYRSHNNTFHTMDLHSNFRGVYCFLSDNNTFVNITAADNFNGMYMHASTNNSVIGSRFKYNTAGVHLSSSFETMLSNNSFHDNADSVVIMRSESIELDYNMMEGGGIFMDGLERSHWNTHRIGDHNLLNGYPVVYITDEHGGSIDGPASQILLSNSSHMTIENMVFDKGNVGMILAFSEHLTVNNVSSRDHSRYGIHLYSVDNSSFEGCELMNNSLSGIYMRYSHHNSISHCHMLDNSQGIQMRDSLGNHISNNFMSQGNDGIRMMDSHQNVLSYNTVRSQRNGFFLSRSDHNDVTHNTAEGNSQYGIRLFDSHSNKIDHNTCEGNAISGLSFSRSTGNSISNSTFNNNDQYGIYLQYGGDNLFLSVTASHNGNSGIRLTYSNNNSVTECTFESNRWYGLYLSYSFLNQFRYNGISHNHHSVYLVSSDDNLLEKNRMNTDKEDLNAILVGLEPLLLKDDAALRKLAQDVGGRVSARYRHIDVIRVVLEDGASGVKALKLLESRPGVRFAEPDGTVELFNVPDDPYFEELWGLEKTDLPAAWNSTTGSGDAVVGVIDTGIDYLHEDLKDNMWTDPEGNHGYNSLENNNDPMDDHGHGTHAAGTVGAVGNNSVGITGVNWNVSLMALKFISAGGTGNISGAVACLEYVLDRKLSGDNVTATSNSWGSGTFSQTLYETVEAHRDEGILFVAAAGNYGDNSDEVPMYPATFNLTNVISVAASDPQDGLASFSNYGPNSVHLAAPGTNIYSTERNNNYGHRSGTSMATPHVTGLAALLRANNRSMDMMELKNAILSHTENKTSFAATISGGRMDANRSLNPSTDGFHVRTRISGGYVGSVGREKDIFVAVNDGLRPIRDANVSVSVNNHAFILKDDGAAADQVSGDGYYSGSWTPTLSGNVTLTIRVDADQTFVHECTISIRSGTGIFMDRSFNNVLEDNAMTMIQDGITLRNSGGNLIYNQSIYDVTKDGINLQNSDSNRLLRNVIKENSQGIMMDSSSFNEVFYNRMESNLQKGVEIYGESRENTIHDNTISDSQYGIYLHTETRNNTLSHNGVYNCIRGIFLRNSNGNRLFNNTALYGDIGLYLNKGDNNLVRYNNFSDNRLHLNGMGMYLSFSYNNTISGNTALDNGRNGIYLGYSDRNEIYDNELSNSDQSGIYLSHSNFNEIYNNSFKENYRGVSLYGAGGNVIYDNIMENNRGGASGYGLFLSSGSTGNHLLLNTVTHNDNGIGISSDNNVVEGNTVTSNTRHGIYVYSGLNRISNNHISNNERGVYLWLGSNDNMIIENHIFNNVYGLEASRSSNKNVVAGNDFVGNNVSVLLDSEYTAVTDNHITDSSVGVGLYRAAHNEIALNTLAYNDINLFVTDESQENRILGNHIRDGDQGILFTHSSISNHIYGNDIKNNLVGINVSHSPWNRFHHNNIMNNSEQVVLHGEVSYWDDGRGQGNYWDDYTGEDITGDGIGDTLVPHPEEDYGGGYYALDYYPLMNEVRLLVYELELASEENGQLVSIPIVPYDGYPGTLLGSVAHKGISSFADNRWHSYVPGRRSHYNNLRYIGPEDAFFIRQKESTTQVIIGHEPISGTTEISLQPGWNMVGHPSLAEKNAGELLPPEVTCVGVFNSSRPYNTQYMEDYSALVLGPGKGYWVYNSADHDITYTMEW
ncbi:MAG: NosD domain-containing protein [Thermoplasmata archaeon]